MSKKVIKGYFYKGEIQERVGKGKLVHLPEMPQTSENAEGWKG